MSVLIINKKASHEYTIHSTYSAGIMLSGAEVKSLRHKHGSLTGSFVKVIGGEVFLVGAQISPYPQADNREYDPIRSRKLLLKKHEISQLVEITSQKGWTLVPLNFEVSGRHIKLKVGVAKGKKQHEKRSELRERDLAREQARGAADSY